MYREAFIKTEEEYGVMACNVECFWQSFTGSCYGIPLLVVGVEMSFGGFIITRAPLFLRSYMTEMTHTDTQKKRTVIAFFPPPFSPPVHITAEIWDWGLWEESSVAGLTANLGLQKQTCPLRLGARTVIHAFAYTRPLSSSSVFIFETLTPVLFHLLCT